ncbi:uncharacterized protein PV09_04946 [Verruconis gallopava]|uniref:Mediator of RNA polymerase II transcription subunit 12 n=1 Tax=Verruconis gallopava TaxID=253628 RepID=A0A0D2ABF8_9PEZI|nr:uncharacterized protein PV09_04946 [Verruconis gallopava]KIW04138.1 hypothetical protein PV09_04946 [Verruconis gallopava]
MLQQSSQHRGGGGAHVRVHSNASSRASSTADDARRSGLKSDLDGLRTPYGSDGGPADVDARSEMSAGSAESSVQQVATCTIPPVGFPPRPAQYARNRNALPWPSDAGGDGASGVDGRAQNFEPPLVSLVYPNGKSADYNPWTGNGPEDTLSEQTVKSGFLNKPTITNESNTARPSIWNPLKHKSGLQTLSSLFVAILEKRQGSGRLTATSTFKPPPRVSLTNTKREAWLSDLANPACALRRFNRTIPYGINGKGLLEQCLAKEIPTARAIWLAKCIGANELRTLKRKGVTGALGISAEQKWVREWTMHVEQFIDATISSRSDQSWRVKMQYVVRLTYHLYVEQLLDQDHFLDWIMSSFEGSSVERLPLWLVHVQLYWRFLTSTRKRGRRLAEAVCNSLHQIEADEENADLLAPISQRLRLLLGTLASSHAGCLIIPKSWTRFEPLVRSMTLRADLASAVASIIERNNRLAKPLWEQNPRSTVSPKRRAFEILDKADADASIPEVCSKLYGALSSPEDVVKLVLEWCSSAYRQGSHRVYLASRILRRYALIGVDIEGYILTFIMDPPSNANIDVHNVIKVVAELVRAKSFAVLKVLRAVIARGAMSDSEHSPQSASRLRELVRGIPTVGLPQHVGDLQRNLLREANEPGLSKLQPVAILKERVEEAIFGRSEDKWSEKEEKLLHGLSIAERFELSAFVRNEYSRLTKAYVETGSSLPGSTRPYLTANMFESARYLLETVEDFPILADVIGICLRQCHHDILVAAIDTIRSHIGNFAAIGALRPLVLSAVERYHIFRNEMPLEKGYLSSLLNLLTSVKSELALIQQVTYDLARCDQRNALAICSPASDNALDLVASSSLESEEEIDRILSSGTTMDEQSITRVFQRITTHLTTPLKARVKAQWFPRLRAFDESTFDTLLSEWVTRLLQSMTEDICCKVLTMLLGSGALSFERLSQIERKIREQSVLSTEANCKLSIVVVSVLLLPGNMNKLEDFNVNYKFRLNQKDFTKKHVDTVLQHLAIALSNLDHDSTYPCIDTLEKVLRNDAVKEFLLGCAIDHKRQLQEHVMNRTLTQRGSALLKDIIEELLNHQGQISASLSSQEKIPQLVKMVGELSLPLCQLEMQLLLNNGIRASEGSTEIATSLFEAIMRSPDSERPPWLDLMDGLDPALLVRLRAIAEMQVLKIVNDCCTRIKGEGNDVDHFQLLRIRTLLRRLLYIVDSTVSTQVVPQSVPQTAQGDVDSPVQDRFGMIRELLAKYFAGDVDSRPLSRMASDLSCCLLNALLHLLVVRKLTSESSKSSPADVASLLPILFSVFTHAALSSSRSTTEFLYDTTAYISDELTDEYRNVLIRSEIPKYPNERRVSFILAPPPSVDAWLGLVTTRQQPQTPSTPTTTTIQQAPPARFGAQQGSPRLPLQIPRPPTPQRQSTTATAQPQKSFNAPVPFHLRRWELLPDPGSSTTANDTSISLSLMGARRV